MKGPKLLLAPLLLLLLARDAAADCVENTYTRDGLQEWEQELLRDCPVSAMGAVSFPTTATSDLAASHFILGLKALHNFFYDVCKVEMEAALAVEPAFGMAYWGRALCSAQLVWNAEDLADSAYWLELASSNGAYPGAMDAREQQYFRSVVTLNDGDASAASKSQRYHAYLAAIDQLAADYPTDTTAAAFRVLARLAASSTTDEAGGPSAAELQAAARRAAREAFALDPSFPGTLHYVSEVASNQSLSLLCAQREKERLPVVRCSWANRLTYQTTNQPTAILCQPIHHHRRIKKPTIKPTIKTGHPRP